MAPTESSPNQSSSVPKSPKGDDKLEETQPETTKIHLADPSVTEILQSTVSKWDKLSDPSTEEALREANQVKVISLYLYSPQLTADLILARNRAHHQRQNYLTVHAWKQFSGRVS